jgi:DNA-binding IclR family transcriptional regulator
LNIIGFESRNKGSLKMAPPKKENRTKYAVPAVQKSFAILEMFASKNQGYTLSEVSRHLKIPVSTASSLLYTMQQCGYLIRNEKARFFLTMKLVTEANKALGQMKLREVAEPELKKLTGTTGLASLLGVRDGDQFVCIEKIEGTSQIVLASHVGKRMYLHQGAAPKALLAYLPESQVEEVLNSAGLPALTENTITSLSVLKQELARIRGQGYAIDNQEVGIGIRGVGAPLFDHNGAVVGAVGVGGSVFEIDQNLKATIVAVESCAAQISERLGYQETDVIRNYTRA